MYVGGFILLGSFKFFELLLFILTSYLLTMPGPHTPAPRAVHAYLVLTEGRVRSGYNPFIIVVL